MNKKAQTGSIYFIFVLIIFGLVWVTGLAPMLTASGAAAVSNSSVQGLEAWFYSNLNLMVGGVYAIAWFFVIRYGF